MKKKRRVLVLLGWHDERALGALVRHAKESGWNMDTRHFFDETVPLGWSGDGMLVSNPGRPNLLQFMITQAPRQPTVLIDRNHPAKLRISAHVHEDNIAAGRIAAEHLLRMGHKHFVWFAYRQGAVADDRLAGFREALGEAGYDCTRLEYQAGDEHDEWQRRRKWLGRQLAKLPRPLGIFTMDDQLAAEAVDVCQECGFNVPGEVMVVGVGNIKLASETSPVPITSVDLNEEEIALTGAKLLDRLMNGGKPPAAPIVIPPRGLVERQSTAALAVTHPLVLSVIDYLRKNISRPFDIHDASAAAGVSSRTLYNLFRSELRCTPVEFLQREQLAKAKSMLESGETRIKELVDACGFGTARTMNRLFLKHEGCSPKAWCKRSHPGK